MKQVSNGAFARESYYNYMSRRMKEEDAKEGIDHRTPEQKIVDLTKRIKQLEIDMAHLIAQK